MIDTESSVGDVMTEISCKNGQLVVKRTQDVEPILEANKAKLAAAPSWRPYGSGKKDFGMREVADIPNIVVEQWMREGLNIFDPSPDVQRRIAMKLNSNEYQHLRTYPGKVGYST